MADAKKAVIIIEKAVSFLFIALAVINLVIVIATSAIIPLFLMILCVFCLISQIRNKDNHKQLPSRIFVLIVATFLLFSTSPFSGIFRWQYPFQRMYIEMMANDDTDGFFPDKLPDDAESFRTGYCPPMMQGSGYYYICFSTDDIGQYRTYTENAVLSFTMEEYRNGLSDENYAEFSKLAEDGYELDFYVDIPDCIDENDYDTEIHIINSNFNWNHPHTDIIFINYDEKTVCYSSVG